METAGRTGIDRPVSFTALNLALANAGLSGLPPQAGTQFETYLELLIKWNSRLNLTAIRAPDGIIQRHFVECIQCAQALPEMPPGATLLDYGSGAGFPGIPISICRPEIRVTLAESQGKKAAFLQEAVRALTLKAEVFDRRVEDMSEERRFSIVTLRAVESMEEACRRALQRVSPGGWMVILVTKTLANELRAGFPQVKWQHPLPTAGMESGEIFFGQLPS